MNRVLALVLIVAASGCLDFDFDVDAPSIGAHSDGDTLVITGCAHTGLFGCDTEQIGRMEVVIDGLRYEVPERTPGLLEIFPSAAFQWVRPSPDSATIEAAFAGTEWVRFSELNWFDLELTDPTGGAPVDRAPGHVRMTYTPLRGAEVSATVTSQCAGGPVSTIATSSAPGILDVPLDDPRLTGPCTHEVALTQTIDQDNNIDALLTISRTVHQMFASDR